MIIFKEDFSRVTLLIEKNRILNWLDFFLLNKSYLEIINLSKEYLSTTKNAIP